MTPKEELIKLLESSFHFQKVMFRSVSFVSAITGIILFILTFVLPVKPEEEQVVLILRIVSVGFILFGWFFSKFIEGRIQKVKKLLFEHPEQISTLKAVTVQKNGIPAFAIRIYTKEHKMIGFNVVGPKTQQKLLALIANEVPHVTIEK